MSNATPVTDQMFLFRAKIRSRSYDEGTVRILETILVAKDVKSLVEVRAALKQFMRDESVIMFREILEESIQKKLLCTDFLVRIFALIGDVESSLALRYEALVMRESKVSTHPWLQVSFAEWFTLAEHSIEEGFYTVANKACDNAFRCFTKNHAENFKTKDLLQGVPIIQKIKTLKNAAAVSISSQSVQAQASMYLKEKSVVQNTQSSTVSFQTQYSGSLRFRSGIKKRNLHRFQQSKRCQKYNVGIQGPQL